MIAAVCLFCKGLVRQVLGSWPVLSGRGDAGELVTRSCDESAVAEMHGDRQRLLGTTLAGGAIAAQALHLSQPQQRHRLGPDEPVGVLRRCFAEPHARHVELAMGG